MRSMRLPAMWLAAISSLAAGCSRESPLGPSAGMWRSRLRIALFERSEKDGTTWGRERLDPHGLAAGCGCLDGHRHLVMHSSGCWHSSFARWHNGCWVEKVSRELAPFLRTSGTAKPNA